MPTIQTQSTFSFADKLSETLATRGVSVFQYGISHLSNESEKWKRRKCPIYDQGGGVNLTEDAIVIPKDKLHIKKVASDMGFEPTCANHGDMHRLQVSCS